MLYLAPCDAQRRGIRIAESPVRGCAAGRSCSHLIVDGNRALHFEDVKLPVGWSSRCRDRDRLCCEEVPSRRTDGPLLRAGAHLPSLPWNSLSFTDSVGKT
jgi:hypothetical protein